MIAHYQNVARSIFLLSVVCLTALGGCPSGVRVERTTHGRSRPEGPAEQRIDGRPLVGHEDQVLAIDISANNRWLITGSEDNTARLWDLTADNPFKAAFVLRAHKGAVTAIAISPDTKSQRRAVLSLLAVTSQLLSGLIATSQM